jgi:hypothetical protein
MIHATLWQATLCDIRATTGVSEFSRFTTFHFVDERDAGMLEYQFGLLSR